MSCSKLSYLDYFHMILEHLNQASRYCILGGSFITIAGLLIYSFVRHCSYLPIALLQTTRHFSQFSKCDTETADSRTSRGPVQPHQHRLHPLISCRGNPTTSMLSNLASFGRLFGSSTATTGNTLSFVSKTLTIMIKETFR